MTSATISSFPAVRIIAVVYPERYPVDQSLRKVADYVRTRGLRCAGFLQRDTLRPGQSRCDMVLEDLMTGQAIGISEDRGACARGCRLDMSELLRAMSLARCQLTTRPSLLIINKYGRAEADGGGFRPLIADAIELDVPVLVAVPERNLASWREFSADLAVDYRADGHPLDFAHVCHQLGLLSKTGRDPAKVPEIVR